MFGFLKKLLPPANEEFYTLFEDAATNCRETARLFCRTCEEGVSNVTLEKARHLKHESNDIVKSIIRKLNHTFITPIDREDIQSLANLLNKITRRIVKACFNLHVYRIQSATQSLESQVDSLMKAAEQLLPVIQLIRNTSQVEKATKLNNQMKEIESKGDDIINEAMAKLFSQPLLPLEVMKYREIHKDIESALDLCYVVSDEVLNILLKHS